MGLCSKNLIRKLALAGAIAPAALAFYGCAQNAKGRIYLIDEFRSVSGNLVVKNGFDPANAEFSLIDGNGYRTTPNQFEFNPDTKNFSFSLEDEHFYESSVGTLIERMLSMGNALPLVGFLDSNSFGRVEKFVKFEIRPAQLAAEKIQKVPYLQFAIPLSKRNLYSSNNDLNFGSALEIGEAVFAQIKVVNAAGVPIEGVDAAAVSYSKVEEGSAPYWHQENYRPIFTKTDAAGMAFIGPIVPNELQAFHILVKGTGYCSFMSASNYKFSSEYEVPSLVAIPCDTQNDEQFALQPSFPTGLKFIDLKDDSFDNPVVHTNEASIYIRLDSSTPNLRGFKVELFETDSKYTAYPEPELTREYPFFQSEVNLDLPKLFKRSQDEAGKFMIKVTELRGALSGFASTTQQAEELTLFGEKRLVKPSREDFMAVEIVSEPGFRWEANLSEEPDNVDYWKNFKIESEAGVENVVSGLAGTKFTMTSSSCRQGYELGFEVIALGITKRFSPCIDGVATFTAEAAGFVSAATKLQTSGGRQVWRVYMKDRYGNESEGLASTNVDDKRLNIMTVIIDTGVPRLDDLSDLNFLEDGTAAGIVYQSKVQSGAASIRFNVTDVQKTCEPLDTDEEQNRANGANGSNATIRSSGVDFPYYLFRDDLGRIVARDSNYERAGLLFVRYAIGSTKAAVDAKPVSEFTRCRKLSDPEDLTSIIAEPTVLTESHIAFPEDPSLPAEFYLRVQDAAGNLSESVKFDLPACTDVTNPSNPQPSSPCWAPTAPPPSP